MTKDCNVVYRKHQGSHIVATNKRNGGAKLMA